MLEDPKFWVATAFVLFIALSYKKTAALLTRTLDDRSGRIKAELDQARLLREEAESVLADYKRKQAEYLKEAEIILQQARTQASALTEQAQRNLKEAMDARMKHALDRIEQEENKAVEDVRNHVVDIALSAARAIIIDHVGNLSQDDLIKLAMVDIERKIH